MIIEKQIIYRIHDKEFSSEEDARIYELVFELAKQIYECDFGDVNDRVFGVMAAIKILGYDDVRTLLQAKGFTV